MQILSEKAKKQCRRVVGLISGTSADGVDAALVELRGSGSNLLCNPLAFETLQWPDSVRRTVLDLCEDRAGIDQLCQAHARLGALFAEAANNELVGILGYEERHLVSADYVNDTRSSIIDAASTLVTDGTMLKVFAWYDNEMGYACRMVDLAKRMVDLNQ